MKLISNLVLLFLFIGCEYTTVSKSICEGNLEDLSGFSGRYNWSLEGQLVPIHIKKVSRGFYRLGSDGTSQGMDYKTCKISGVNIVEFYEDGVIQLLKAQSRANQLSIKSIMFDTALLDRTGVGYNLETGQIEGVPVQLIEVENTTVANNALIEMQASDDVRVPYEIILTRR
jgi:hypothetical protein